MLLIEDPLSSLIEEWFPSAETLAQRETFERLRREPTLDAFRQVATILDQLGLEDEIETLSRTFASEQRSLVVRALPAETKLAFERCPVGLSLRPHPVRGLVVEVLRPSGAEVLTKLSEPVLSEVTGLIFEVDGETTARTLKALLSRPSLELSAFRYSGDGTIPAPLLAKLALHRSLEALELLYGGVNADTAKKFAKLPKLHTLKVTAS